MKKLVDALDEFARKMTGREISLRELNKSNKGFSESKVSFFGNNRTETKYSINKNGNPQIEIAISAIKTTPDVSDSRRSHTGFYNEETRVFEYDNEGRLLREDILLGNGYDGRGWERRVYEFDPPGRFRGKRISKEGTRQTH